MKTLRIKKKTAVLFLFLFALSATSFAQERPRIVQTQQEESSNQEQTLAEQKPAASYVRRTNSTRPTYATNKTGLRNEIRVVRKTPAKVNRLTKNPSVRKTSSVKSVRKTSSVKKVLAAPSKSYGSLAYTPSVESMMLRSMKKKVGKRYVYGSSGPYSYDCSGFIWAVFQDIGFNFNRTSARNYWKQFEPAHGADRYKFGTLVFFNRLGHVGIVVDNEGFYHASSSRGVIYSKFEGYWGKRITGFRRIPNSRY